MQYLVQNKAPGLAQILLMVTGISLLRAIFMPYKELDIDKKARKTKELREEVAWHDYWVKELYGD